MIIKLLIIYFFGIILLKAQDSERIVGGFAIDINRRPYIVSLHSVGMGEQLCGGTIIGIGFGNSTWVVTAAHCVTNDTFLPFFARAGSSYKDNGGITFDVINIVPHPEYNNETQINDIALLQLNGIVTVQHGGAKIKLPKQNEIIRTGSKVSVSGWGYTNKTDESREKLRSVSLNIIDQDSCRQSYLNPEVNFTITENMICAAAAGKDACQYDSGGPLVFRNQKLVGIVSGGVGCAMADYPGFYTYVSHYRNWIRDTCGI